MSTTLAPDAPASAKNLPPGLTLLLATACGLIVANVYYAQPLAGPIGAAIGLAPSTTGLIVTMTQIGYVAGLLLVVPLADVMENRRLVLTVMAVNILALAAASLATGAIAFLGAALAIGVASVSVQILLPYAAHLSPSAVRGRTVGNVMVGTMLGIMLARPAASFIADVLSWHAVFAISAVVLTVLAPVLRLALPARRPAPGTSYGALLGSMGGLVKCIPVLRRRAIYHACLFCVFSLFWTTVPLLLSGTYHLSQTGIALFALAGVAGAVSAPLAGRAADRGWSRRGTGAAMLIVVTALLFGRLGLSDTPWGLGMLVAAAVLLDFGVTANLVFGQRAIFSLPAELRGRLNALYMATFFAGGAVGSALGGWAFAEGGWSLSMWLALAFEAAAFGYFLSERECAESGMMSDRTIIPL